MHWWQRYNETAAPKRQRSPRLLPKRPSFSALKTLRAVSMRTGKTSCYEQCVYFAILCLRLELLTLDNNTLYPRTTTFALLTTYSCEWLLLPVSHTINSSTLRILSCQFTDNSALSICEALYISNHVHPLARQNEPYPRLHLVVLPERKGKTMTLGTRNASRAHLRICRVATHSEKFPQK